jgi:hypothetical protein
VTVWGWLYLAATSTVLLCGMVLRSPLAVATETPSDTGATVRRSPERPWLTREAAAQVVRDDGGLGPLFDGLTLGGPPPSPALRARLAAFEAANDVHLGVEIGEGVVVAVRSTSRSAAAVGTRAPTCSRSRSTARTRASRRIYVTIAARSAAGAASVTGSSQGASTPAGSNS